MLRSPDDIEETKLRRPTRCSVYLGEFPNRPGELDLDHHHFIFDNPEDNYLWQRMLEDAEIVQGQNGTVYQKSPELEVIVKIPRRSWYWVDDKQLTIGASAEAICSACGTLTKEVEELGWLCWKCDS